MQNWYGTCAPKQISRQTIGSMVKVYFMKVREIVKYQIPSTVLKVFKHNERVMKTDVRGQLKISVKVQKWITVKHAPKQWTQEVEWLIQMIKDKYVKVKIFMKTLLKDELWWEICYTVVVRCDIKPKPNACIMCRCSISLGAVLLREVWAEASLDGTQQGSFFQSEG